MIGEMTFLRFFLIGSDRRPALGEGESAIRRPSSSGSRLHPDGAIESDGLAVEHGVGDDGLHQLRVLVGVTQARRVRHRLRQERPHLREAVVEQ